MSFGTQPGRRRSGMLSTLPSFPLTGFSWLPLLPIGLGILAATFLFVGMFANLDWVINPLNWPIVTHSPSKLYGVLFGLLFVDLVVVLGGTGLYIYEIQ